MTNVPGAKTIWVMQLLAAIYTDVDIFQLVDASGESFEIARGQQKVQSVVCVKPRLSPSVSRYMAAAAQSCRSRSCSE